MGGACLSQAPLVLEAVFGSSKRGLAGGDAGAVDARAANQPGGDDVRASRHFVGDGDIDEARRAYENGLCALQANVKIRMPIHERGEEDEVALSADDIRTPEGGVAAELRHARFFMDNLAHWIAGEPLVNVVSG